MDSNDIPSEDAEKLAELCAWLRVKMPATEDAQALVAEIAVKDAYRLGAQHRSDYARHLDTALSELAIDRVGAVRDAKGWTVSVSSNGADRTRTAATLVEALLECVLAIEEMREASTIKVGDHVRVAPGCFVPEHLRGYTPGYASNEDYLLKHLAPLSGVVSEIDGDIVRLNGRVDGHRIERYERVPEADGAALLASKAGR